MPTADPWVDNSFAPLHSLGDPGHPFTRPPGRQKEASGASTQDEPLPPTEITSPPKHPQQVLVCQLHKGAVFPSQSAP